MPSRCAATRADSVARPTPDGLRIEAGRSARLGGWLEAVAASWQEGAVIGRIEGALQSATDPGVDALVARARSFVGARVGSVAASLGILTGSSAVRTKGTAGEILERALGATGGSAKVLDFPELGVELKTIPVDGRGVPSESTYVCTLAVAEAENEEWERSWVRQKLSRVLFVPLVEEPDATWRERRIGPPRLWSPTAAQEDVLRADFDDIVGLIGVGRIEELTAHRGRWLQVRPKAAHGRVRTVAWGSDGEAIATIPRGFYLRPRFTGAILVDPAAVPEA